MRNVTDPSVEIPDHPDEPPLPFPLTPREFAVIIAALQTLADAIRAHPHVPDGVNLAEVITLADKLSASVGMLSYEEVRASGAKLNQ